MIRKYWDIVSRHFRRHSVWSAAAGTLFGCAVFSLITVRFVWAQEPELRPLAVYGNPREVNAELYVRIDIEKRSAETEDKKKPVLRLGAPVQPRLQVWMSHPHSWDEQWATEARWSYSKPTFAYLDPENGNLIHVWQKPNVAVGDSLLIRKRFKVTSFEVEYTVDPQTIGRYNKNSYIYRRYTQSEQGIETSGAVRDLARLIVGDEKNPYLQARLLFGWIILNMAYSDVRQEYSAQLAIETRLGDSAHYGLVFVALCRALHIPARLVCGHWSLGNRGQHVWTEFYLPNYGWIPSDPSEADYDNPEIITDTLYKRYFGHLDNTSIVISKGMNIALWPYLRGKWLNDFGLSADGNSQMMQIVDYTLEGVDAFASYRYNWTFWE